MFLFALSPRGCAPSQSETKELKKKKEVEFSERMRS